MRNLPSLFALTLYNPLWVRSDAVHKITKNRPYPNRTPGWTKLTLVVFKQLFNNKLLVAAVERHQRRITQVQEDQQRDNKSTLKESHQRHRIIRPCALSAALGTETPRQHPFSKQRRRMCKDCVERELLQRTAVTDKREFAPSRIE